MKKNTLFFAFLLSISAIAQSGSIKGKITFKGENVVGALVQIKRMELKGDVSNELGNYNIEKIPKGTYIMKVSSLGFHPIEKKIHIISGKTVIENFSLQEDLLNIGQVVVTSTRGKVASYKSPIIVNNISSDIFESTQSLSLSEGLAFSPGLRVETNCQNCGFSQLRMNGLEGAYSQILINSRPIYSALVGVYGLDMIPSNMIDRVEVVKGGGSVLYGGSAIGGTVNIITKDPTKDSFEIGLNQSYTELKKSDRTLTVSGNVVGEDLNKGLRFFGFNRNREPWDANNDNFSELTKLKNNTFGFDAFWNTSTRSKLKISIHSISEFRRGGNKFDLEPHQSDITEQLDHKILSLAASFEQYSSDHKHKFAIYSSGQNTKRKSYYGGGGRVLKEGDEFTEHDLVAINAYGNSKDFSSATGIQYNYDINSHFILSAGTEYQHNDVKDKMPGYFRAIDQKVNTIGSYAQLEIKPVKAVTILLGGRYDNVNIDGKYVFGNENFTLDKKIGVFVPRVSAMYNVSNEIKLRASYAQGYRAPQAFDEDLHIETVGGDAVFIQMSPNLKVEKSNNLTASFNYTKIVGDFQANFVVEGFYTKIDNPFTSLDLKMLDSGIKVKEKQNGDGAKVTGGNIEFNFAYTQKFIAQLGLTIQNSKYTKAEAVWEPEVGDTRSAVFTKHILRTPNSYGFFSFTYKPTETLNVYWSGIYTGEMKVPHVLDPNTEYTIVKETPAFFENNFKVSYDWNFSRNCVELFTGIQNAFNSFQKDFDKGADRDAGYIYGPRKPRTLFMGLKYTFGE